MQIQNADTAARRHAIIVAAVLIILLGGALVALQSLGADWLANHISARPILLPAIGVLLIMPVLVFAVYVFRKGGRVIRALRFPVPGDRIIRDTVVREGQAAVMVGRLMQLLSALLVICSLWIPWLLWRLSETLVIA